MTPAEKHLLRYQGLAALYSDRSLEAIRLNDGISAACFENDAEYCRKRARELAEQMSRPVEPEVED